MKTLLTIFVSMILISQCFAQKDLFPADSSEISFREDIAYLNGSPFTGLLIDKKTNNKIGEYINGYKNGKFTEYYSKTNKKNDGKYITGIKEGIHTGWFPNGNKEYEYRYVNGKENGVCTDWFENNNKRSEIYYTNGRRNGLSSVWYENGQLRFSIKQNNGNVVDGTYVIYSKNGQKEKEETYQGGQKVHDGIYKDGQLFELFQLFYPNKKNKKIEGYLKNGLRDGLWSEWSEDGNLKSQVNYKNSKEDGVCTWWWPNGEKMKEVNYVKGNLVSILYENSIDPRLSINKNMKPGAYLFRCLSSIEDDTTYVMVSFDFERTEKNKVLENNILASLGLRLKQLSVADKFLLRLKLLKYSITFSSPNFAVALEGKLTLWSDPGYVGQTTVMMHINNLINGKVLFNNMIVGKTKKHENEIDAYADAPTVLNSNIVDKIYNAFKIRTTIKNILETDGDGNAEKIGIWCGENFSIPKGFIFFVCPEDNLNYIIIEIRVIKLENNLAVCEVIEGKEFLSNIMKSGKKLVAISKLR